MNHEEKADKILELCAGLYKDRNKKYGDNYKRYGRVMQAMFTPGMVLGNSQEHNRFGLLSQIVYKLTRYVSNFHKGGHEDSALDASTYLAMLVELDREIKSKEEAKKGE